MSAAAADTFIPVAAEVSEGMLMPLEERLLVLLMGELDLGVLGGLKSVARINTNSTRFDKFS